MFLYSGCGRVVQGAGHKAKRLVLQCISDVSSNLVEGRTKNCQLKHLILTLFSLIFRRIYQIFELSNFVLPSTGFELIPLLHCSTIRLALRPAPQTIRPHPLPCIYIYIFMYMYIRLKIKPNSVRIRFQSCQMFILPSTGFELIPLIHCSTIRLALRPVPQTTRQHPLPIYIAIQLIQLYIYNDTMCI